MRAKTRLTDEARLVAVAVIPVAAALVIGQIATYPNLASWYAGLIKPGFNPPNWVFAPVWTTLFVLMAFAVWRVLTLGALPIKSRNPTPASTGHRESHVRRSPVWASLRLRATYPLPRLMGYRSRCRGYPRP